MSGEFGRYNNAQGILYYTNKPCIKDSAPTSSCIDVMKSYIHTHSYMSFQIATAIFKFVAGRTIACSQQDASLAQKAANLFSQFGNSTILPQGEPCQPSWQCAGRVIPLIPTCSFSDLLTRNTSQILLNSLSNILFI